MEMGAELWSIVQAHGYRSTAVTRSKRQTLNALDAPTDTTRIDMVTESMIVHDYEALLSLLDEWKKWQRSYRIKTGFPSRSALIATSGGTDFEEMCAQSDHWRNETIDTCVNDLPPAQCAAVMKCVGIVAVFRFPRANYCESLLHGLESLSSALPRKGVAL